MIEKTYIGIDPGAKGGIVALRGNEIIMSIATPEKGGDMDVEAILFEVTRYPDAIIIIEDVHSIFGSSAKANFSFGRNVGQLNAILQLSGLRYHYVPPKTWQKEIWTNVDKLYKPKKPNQKNASVDTKKTSLNTALRLFPGHDFRKSERSKIPHDGIVDASLIAEYGR